MLRGEDKDGASIAVRCISIGIQIFGVWGSYANNLTFLIIFGSIMFVAVVFCFFRDRTRAKYLTLGHGALTLILVTAQIILIHKGYASSAR